MHRTIRNHLVVFFILVATPGSADGADWKIPTAGEILTFPKDHGSHPDYKIEWWYLTGHLFSGEKRFGFQATFFRLGQEPVDVAEQNKFGGSQWYLAHMGLSDPAAGIFIHEEKLNRGGWDAGAKVGDLDVRNGNWSLRREGDGFLLSGSIRSDASFTVRLDPGKGPVIFGEDGVSRKGPEGTAASYYITFPRIPATGSIRLGGELYEVEGEAWMDHEISSSQLDRNQIGWDWTCIQFNDGREIMAYTLRTEDGGVSEYSRLVWVDERGGLVHQTADNFEWRHEGSWISPVNGADYPVSPLLIATDPVSNERKQLRLVPVMEDQEIVGNVGGVSYWEGACDVRDESSGEIVGRAFLEMTGYADNIGDKLR